MLRTFQLYITFPSMLKTKQILEFSLTALYAMSLVAQMQLSGKSHRNGRSGEQVMVQHFMYYNKGYCLKASRCLKLAAGSHIRHVHSTLWRMRLLLPLLLSNSMAALNLNKLHFQVLNSERV